MGEKMFNLFIKYLLNIPNKRPPDFIVGGVENPYLKRWWLIPRNPIFNFYLHQFLRSDDDRALHDHPYSSFSWLLKGEYWEIKAAHNYLGIRYQHYTAGDYIMRWSGKYAHRIEVQEPCWTLFITGPRYRNWGFHCPQGWIPWQQFTDPSDKGGIGRGCD